MRKLATLVIASLLVLGVGYLGLLLVYGATSSLRYGPNSQEDRRIGELAASKDAPSLNEALLTTKSLSGKMVIMKYLGDLGDDRSLPYLVKMLSFDLPWYELLDSELAPRPKEVRFSAHRVIASFGQDRAQGIVLPLLDSKNPLERMYAAGILARWGNPTGDRVLTLLAQGSDSKLAEEAIWVKRMALSSR